MAKQTTFVTIVLVLMRPVLSSLNGECIFDKGEKVSSLTDRVIDEASGLAASRTHANVLYTHNDSGGQARIFALDVATGRILATINIDNATNLDWEDMATGPCPGGGNCVYIADVGGNAGGVSNTIYRIKEPNILEDSFVPLDSFLKFKWDQANCEIIMVDPDSEVYLVSKVWEGRAKLVRLPKSGWGNASRVDVESEVYLPMATPDGPTGGDMSLNGKEVLIKTYTEVFYWKLGDESIFTGILKKPLVLPYRCERQGEGICWDSAGKSYYTLSEGYYPGLYFYSRTTGCVNDAIIPAIYIDRILLMCLISYILYNLNR